MLSLDDGMRKFMNTALTDSARAMLSRQYGVDPDKELSKEDFIESIIAVAKERAEHGNQEPVHG